MAAGTADGAHDARLAAVLDDQPGNVGLVAPRIT
jgi:hypothetical protein